MSTAQGRSREKQDLRGMILDAARELFATESHKDVSMRRIADKIDHSAGSIYLYFKDKDEILRSLSEEGFKLLADRLAAIKSADALENLREAAATYLDFALSQPHYYRLMFDVGDMVPSAAKAPEQNRQSRRAYQLLADCIHNGVSSGDLSAQLGEIFATHILWAELHGIASLALSGRLELISKSERRAFFESAVDSVLCGLSPTCDA